MPALLHEYWENADGGQFGPVRECADGQRPKLLPDARLAFGLYASSWFEAQRLEYERLGYGDYTPPQDIPDYFYTAEDEAEQLAYLERREVR
ncbi:hypothetical protein [Sphingopyxis sp. KK2]|uniref:hypothetical protein n=1 Tax=Sphingopyxis sp. KK2 TaxID=1855727 RepID=UPI00097E6174|nr:hypothetical protein [Sphingopyxis sp. KK2]